MNLALIGHSGFVGQNLKSSANFSSLYNSQNISDIAGKSFDLIYCAGVSASKWQANKDPENDLRNIRALSAVLKKVHTKKFVLISTVDVYPIPLAVDEDFSPMAARSHAYGTNRLAFEDFVKENFDSHLIVRLPALFGQGLKKNIIFDMINSRCLEAIQPLSSFQYYALKHLHADIHRSIKLGVSLINITSEPLITEELRMLFFPDLKIGSMAAPPGHYNLKSKYASHWGGKSGYLYSKQQVLNDMQSFLGRTAAR